MSSVASCLPASSERAGRPGAPHRDQRGALPQPTPASQGGSALRTAPRGLVPQSQGAVPETIPEPRPEPLIGTRRMPIGATGYSPDGSNERSPGAREFVQPALHAPLGAIGPEEDPVAELLLGDVVVAVDRLVVETPGQTTRRAEDVGALVTVLEATGVKPAGLGVRVRNGLVDLVAERADLGVGVDVAVRRLLRREP